MPHKLYTFLIVLLVLCSFCNLAQEPAADPIDAGIDYLIGQIQSDPEGWAVPPRRNQKIIRKEKVIRRYRMVEVEIPVYEKVEKEIMVRRKGDSGGAQGRMERKTVMVNGKQIGTRIVKRRKRDPEGPIKREEVRNIHGPGGPDLWRLGDVGHNGLIAYVLQRQPRPEIRDIGYNLAVKLEEWVETFGTSDLTWDLVWLIAAFSESEDASIQSRVPEMVQKLVDSQIQQGPAEGLWGPVAIQPERLRFWLQSFVAESAAYAEVKAEHGDSDRPKRIQLVLEAEKRLTKAREELSAYTPTTGLRVRTERPFVIRMNMMRKRFSVNLPNIFSIPGPRIWKVPGWY